MGLQMLMLWDNQAKQATEDRELRLALLASGKFTLQQAFPDLFPPEEDEEKDEFASKEYEYESPAGEFEKIMATLQANRRITTRDAPETSEGVTGTIPLGPDDAEWI